MGSSFLQAAFGALGLVTVSCGFDWDGVYDSRFGGNAQAGTGASITVAGYGNGLGGADSARGGAVSDETGGMGARNGGTGGTVTANGGAGGTEGTTVQTGGTGTGGNSSGGTGAGGWGGEGACAGNLLENPGFELADKKGVPTGWERLSPQSSSDGSFTVVATSAFQGLSSLFLDTTGLKKPPADYILVVATSQAYDVTTIPTLYLSAAAWVDDPFTPIWVAVLYFDSSGGLLGVLTGGNVLTVDHLEFAPAPGFVLEGPLPSSVPRLAAEARVGLIAGQGVAAYIDSVCLTR